MTDFDYIVVGGGSGGCALAGRLSEDPNAKVCLIEAGLNGRNGYQPRGKTLGGSSAINAMLYIRGHQRYYDEWRELGNLGWGWSDVLPYFKKSEGNSRGNDELHGADGPLSVTELRNSHAITSAFVEAARQNQIQINEDFNGPKAFCV